MIMIGILILLLLIVLYIFSQNREHFERSHELIGPKRASVYDPTYRPRKCRRKKPIIPGQSEITQGPTSFQPPEDDGTHRSDTATTQFSIYFYKPFATLPFPTSPPPQPYLNDFKPFQR